MKKRILMIAAVLLLCLGCACAEEIWTAEDEAEWLAQLPVESGLIYEIWNDPDLGQVAVVYGFDLEPGQTVLFVPPELGGYPVSNINGWTLPESVHTVYCPESTGGIFPELGRKLTMVFYGDADYMQKHYKGQMNEIGMTMDEDEYALISAYLWKTAEDDYLLSQDMAYLARRTIPQELFGHPVNITMLERGGWIAYEAGSCSYYIATWNGMPVIIDAGVEEGAHEMMIPPELAEYEGVLVSIKDLGDDIRAIYVPDGLTVYLFDVPKGREYLTLSYTQDEANGLVLTGSQKVYIDVQDYEISESVLFAENSMPQEVLGCAVDVSAVLSAENEALHYEEFISTPIDAEAERLFNTTFAYGGLLYTVDPYAKTATIVGYDLPPEQTELFVPTEIDGYTFTTLEHELVPQQIQSLWINANCGMRTWNFGDKPKNFERTNYTYEQTTENSITLLTVAKNTWDENSQWESEVQYIYTDTLPETIAGNKLLFADNPHLLRRENGWEYHVVGEEVQITAVPETQGRVLVVPDTLGGYPVDSIYLELIPETVEVVCIKGEIGRGGIVPNETADRRITEVTYTDWAGADVKDVGGRPSHMQEDELMWLYISTFDYATGNFLHRPDNVVCDTELPQEINGRRVIFPRYLNDLAITSGDWQYLREINGSAVIWAYVGEESPEELTVPDQIDGCKVYAFVSSNMPEGVSVVYDPAMQVLDYSR